MKTVNVFFYSLIMISCMTACAHLGKETWKSSTEEEFLEHSLREAVEHETREEWVEALTRYRIALTLSPGNSQAIDGRRQMEERVKSLAEERYKVGQRYRKEGKLEEARQHFLATLRLWPDHQHALRTLTSRKRLDAEGYIVHTIQPGESLSGLASAYYGDPARFTVIAQYNRITDADLVRVGHKIKIPLLADPAAEPSDEKMPEAEEKGKGKESPQGYWDWSSLDSELAERKRPSEKPETDQLASYRELGMEFFREGRYQEALFEFNKVLTAYPDDEVAIDYSYRASLELALDLFRVKDYLAAREHFLASLRYNGDSQQCRAYVKESEELYKEMHYKKGIEFYGKEQLTEAIKEWETVQMLDPDYKRVGYYVRKTREIQKKLEELKQQTQQGLVDE
jgi:tetratricopeptide (TPR) repeat protein